MIVLHHLVVGRSVFTAWLLEELALDYELKVYHRLETRRAPAELKEIHPLGKSPVIEVDGQVIAESGAIAEYLLERFDADHRLAPSMEDWEERARFLQWLHYPEGSAFAPMLMVLLKLSSGQSLGAFADEWAKTETELHLDYLRDSLNDRSYILGDRFSAADVGLSYIVSLADRLQLLDPYPTLAEYLARTTNRDAFRRAWQRTGG